MTHLKFTNEVARALGVSEWRVRDLRKRGLLCASAHTTKGAALHTDADIAAAKARLTSLPSNAAQKSAA